MNPLIQLKKAAPVFLVAVVCFRFFADNASGQTPTPTPTPTPTVTPTTCGSSFVIGDLDAVVGNHVTFWGAQWRNLNHLSGGEAPASFKGFANCTNPNPPDCGGTWQSDPGNSSGPPESVPADITVIVSSLITKSGSIESGDIPMMVTIHTDPGYEPNPGHEGTGTVTAVVCQSTHPPLFNGETALGNGWYYLQFANGTPFGYYSYLSDQHFIYHIDLGYEYLLDANDANHGIYVYDFASSSFFYTSPTLFPYLYDFSLNAWLYYLPGTHNPRWFYNTATGQWITL